MGGGQDPVPPVYTPIEVHRDRPAGCLGLGTVLVYGLAVGRENHVLTDSWINHYTSLCSSYLYLIDYWKHVSNSTHMQLIIESLDLLFSLLNGTVPLLVGVSSLLPAHRHVTSHSVPFTVYTTDRDCRKQKNRRLIQIRNGVKDHVSWNIVRPYALPIPGPMSWSYKNGLVYITGFDTIHDWRTDSPDKR